MLCVEVSFILQNKALTKSELYLIKTPSHYINNKINPIIRVNLRETEGGLELVINQETFYLKNAW